MIDTANVSFVPKKKYDICIDAYGNLERFAPLLEKDCIKVFLATTSDWLFQNTASYKRSYDLLQRRGVVLPPERLLPPSRTLTAADMILLMGNDVTASTYAYAKKPISPLSVSAVREYPSPVGKDFDAYKKNFVWLGGAGAVHKGADLTLEAFAREADLHVSMCGKYLYPEFEAVYWKELHESDNIHSIGHLDLGGEVFEKIRSQAIFLIFPSCAEGQSGGVVAAMHAGLIPIISKECGVSVDDFGFVLKENTIEEIQKTIRYVSSLPAEELASRARRAWEYAQANHTREVFTMQFKNFVNLLESKNTK